MWKDHDWARGTAGHLVTVRCWNSLRAAKPFHSVCRSSLSVKKQDFMKQQWLWRCWNPHSVILTSQCFLGDITCCLIVTMFTETHVFFLFCFLFFPQYLFDFCRFLQRWQHRHHSASQGGCHHSGPEGSSGDAVLSGKRSWIPSTL